MLLPSFPWFSWGRLCPEVIVQICGVNFLCPEWVRPPCHVLWAPGVQACLCVKSESNASEQRKKKSRGFLQPGKPVVAVVAAFRTNVQVGGGPDPTGGFCVIP